MHVQRVAMPASRVESWTVLDDGVPVEPVERYLAYLSDIERSPNTVRAYAHDLKDYWVFLARRGLDWREVRLEDIGEYVAWLRLPPWGRDGAVAVLPSVEPHVGAATINRKLSALAAFYGHQARHGVDVGELLTTWQLPSRLDTHRDLPIIAWTVLPAGSALVGHVNGLAPADEVRQAFHAWRTALTLIEHSEVTSGGGTTHLRAAADRNRVRVALSATLFDDGGQATR